MLFNPFETFPFELQHGNKVYAGHIRPWPRKGHTFPDQFTITVGNGMFFAHISYLEGKGWSSNGGAADPDVVRTLGNFIIAWYE